MMSGQVIEKYIPINKGHFELDTPERHSEFHRKLSNGWEAEYEEYRRLWVDLPKKRIIRDYPLLVDLELSSACNLLCPMCYTITDEFKGRVKRSMMEFELFKKIVREIAGKVFAIRLSLRGEPTLHPNFIECITFAKEQGIKEISSLTNGSRLSLDYFKRMAEAGLDWLTISIDGINEEYEKIRRPLKFIETLQKLKDRLLRDHNALCRYYRL
jgi:MoaA/NifB/PqqE/SkfB family radical SAM enzyme